ncbi:hypothetical protein GJAV_G00176190 [Gymnothorax javanicus]|nr:hypothetical protein GJAV_G00176190 [Gymnothorax javanicus]
MQEAWGDKEVRLSTRRQSLPRLKSISVEGATSRSDMASADTVGQIPHPHSPEAQHQPLKMPCSEHSLSLCPEPSTPGIFGDEQVVPTFQRLSINERGSQHTPSCPLKRGPRPLPPLPGPVELSVDHPVEGELPFHCSVEDGWKLVPEPYHKLSTFCPGDLTKCSFRGCGEVNYAYLEGPCRVHIPVQRKEDWQEQATPHLLDGAHRRLRRSHSGPALWQHCPQHGSPSQDKPQVPPRMPKPPQMFQMLDPARRWSTDLSAEQSDEEKPPKVPPRGPVSTGPQTSGPRSLPTYLNGVMPPTQSFAPDPKYVSHTLQRQHSEGSPCILPIMEQGRKASHTHYFLLPQRPAYLDRLERFLRGAECEQRGQGTSGS